MALLDYPSMSDSELHSLYLTGDAEAGNALVLRYRRLVKACARPFFLAGGDSEDLMQEGMIGLLSAIREFDPDGGASLRYFAELCIRRRLISAARSALSSSVKFSRSDGSQSISAELSHGYSQSISMPCSP